MRGSECGSCGYGPCACSYILRLQDSGSGVYSLAGVALAQLDALEPHRDACPCPGCYSARLASWVGEVAF